MDVGLVVGEISRLPQLSQVLGKLRLAAISVVPPSCEMRLRRLVLDASGVASHEESTVIGSRDGAALTRFTRLPGQVLSKFQKLWECQEFCV